MKDDLVNVSLEERAGMKAKVYPKVYNLKMSAEQCANLVRSIVLVTAGKTETFSLSWANITVTVQLLNTPTTQIVQEN